MTSRVGRTGYRDPNARRGRHTWRPTQSQLDLLEPHRFEGEAFQPFINRLLRRLAKAIETGTAPVAKFESDDMKEKPRSFRADPTVEQLMQSHKQGNNQATIDYLLGWAISLPRASELQSADEVMGLLRSLNGDRHLTTEVMRMLCDHTTEARAKEWLWELFERGKIRLVRSGFGVRLGAKNYSYEYLSIEP